MKTTADNYWKQYAFIIENDTGSTLKTESEEHRRTQGHFRAFLSHSDHQVILKLRKTHMRSNAENEYTKTLLREGGELSNPVRFLKASAWKKSAENEDT